MKCCPKCGSANITFSAFYRPSTWKCLDCGYEGAFIVEDGKLSEEVQECCEERCNVIDWAKVIIDNSQETEEHVKSVVAIVVKITTTLELRLTRVTAFLYLLVSFLPSLLLGLNPRLPSP